MVTCKGSTRYWNYLETYAGPMPADSRQLTPSVRARPDKLGTDTIACIASVSFSLRVENNQVDAGQDGQTRLARPNSQARAGTGKCSFSLFS